MKDFNVFDLREEQLEEVMELHNKYNEWVTWDCVMSDLEFLQMVVDEGLDTLKRELLEYHGGWKYSREKKCLVKRDCYKKTVNNDVELAFKRFFPND